MSKRREVRERVLQALYARELSGDEPEHILAHLVAPFFRGEDKYLRFAEKLFLFALDTEEEANELLAKHAQNWEAGRMAVLDRLALRMGITEFLKFEDIPPKVTINETIEVARAFSTDRSGGFVNGILDAVLADLREQGRLKKSGRGLVGMTS